MVAWKSHQTGGEGGGRKSCSSAVIAVQDPRPPRAKPAPSEGDRGRGCQWKDGELCGWGELREEKSGGAAGLWEEEEEGDVQGHPCGQARSFHCSPQPLLTQPLGGVQNFSDFRAIGGTC